MPKDDLCNDKVFGVFITWHFLGLYFVLEKNGGATALSPSVPGMVSKGAGTWQSRMFNGALGQFGMCYMYPADRRSHRSLKPRRLACPALARDEQLTCAI